MQLIGVNHVSAVNFNPTGVRGFIDRTDVEFPIGFDLSSSYADLRVASTVGGSSNSVHIIIDRDGKVAYLAKYYQDNHETYDFAPVLDALLQQ